MTLQSIPPRTRGCVAYQSINETTEAMRVAIADDDRAMRSYIEEALLPSAHLCVQFPNGRELITALQRETFDLLLVDWNMPEQSGMEVVHWVHSNLRPAPPIIVVTSRTDNNDVVRALEAGADDYIVKPAAQSIILARVNSALRRSTPQRETQRVQAYGDYAFDRLTNSISVGERQVVLTGKEFALAKLFFDNPHRPLSRGYILHTVWNSVADLPTRTLDMHVSRIRTKLVLKPENGYRLQTIFGFGYRLESFREDV